tara:strand:+ start:6210 stop:6392 length:183 start_codon:yes stop_codon:yes gene_type:complete
MDKTKSNPKDNPEDYFTITADGFVWPLQNGCVGPDEPIYHKDDMDLIMNRMYKTDNNDGP